MSGLSGHNGDGGIVWHGSSGDASGGSAKTRSATSMIQTCSAPIAFCPRQMCQQLVARAALITSAESEPRTILTGPRARRGLAWIRGTVRKRA